MDLVSFIPGVGPTASFSPGASTPPPFNVSHVGLTDGTSPATASNNMAEIYNRLMLNIASTIVAAGLTVDNNNWAQLPQAVSALVNQGLSNFASSISTPPQFDNDLSLPTTAFVQRALGNYRSAVEINTNIGLTSADAGKIFYVTANATITLNPTGLPTGATYTFIVENSVAGAAVSLTSGIFIDPVFGNLGLSNIGLKARNQYAFTWDGSNFRTANGGHLNDQVSSTGTNGFAQLSNGLMFQWGIDTTAIGETTRTVLMPWTFPTKCLNVSITGRSDGTTITNNNVPQLVSMGTSSFTYFSQGIAETSTPVNPNQGIYWMAIGV